MVERIIKHINIPLSVDIEGGYSRNIDNIDRNIQKLIDLGVSGINIEYSIVVNGVRTQIDFAAKLFNSVIESQKFDALYYRLGNKPENSQ